VHGGVCGQAVQRGWAEAGGRELHGGHAVLRRERGEGCLRGVPGLHGLRAVLQPLRVVGVQRGGDVRDHRGGCGDGMRRQRWPVRRGRDLPGVQPRAEALFRASAPILRTRREVGNGGGLRRQCPSVRGGRVPAVRDLGRLPCLGKRLHPGGVQQRGVRLRRQAAGHDVSGRDVQRLRGVQRVQPWDEGVQREPGAELQREWPVRFAVELRREHAVL
jgi:hypothetical protein